MFSSSRVLVKDDPLECGADADRERAVRWVRALVDAAGLIANIPRSADGRRRRQGRIESLVARESEQVLRLHIDSRRREPDDPRPWHLTPDLLHATTHIDS